jgi:hypothetical protein
MNTETTSHPRPAPRHPWSRQPAESEDDYGHFLAFLGHLLARAYHERSGLFPSIEAADTSRMLDNLHKLGVRHQWPQRVAEYLMQFGTAIRDKHGTYQPPAVIFLNSEQPCPIFVKFAPPEPYN